MSIQINLSEWLGKRKMSQRKLSDLTGIRPGTVNLMYHEKIKRIEIDQINELCNALECQPGDLFTHTPDKK